MGQKKKKDISNWVGYENRRSIYNRWKIVTFEVESVKPTGSTHKAHLFDLNHESIRCTDSAALVQTNGSWAGSIYRSGSTQFQMNLTQKLISKCPKPQSSSWPDGDVCLGMSRDSHHLLHPFFKRFFNVGWAHLVQVFPYNSYFNQLLSWF